MKDLFKAIEKVILYRPALWLYRLLANAWVIYVKAACKFSNQLIDDKLLRAMYKEYVEMLDHFNDNFDYWSAAEAKTYGVTANVYRVMQFYAEKYGVTLES